MYSLAWSPDRTRLVSPSGDATLRIHDTGHPISRHLQAEQRKERIARQTARLEALVRELGDPAAAARQLCAEAEDPGSRQAARRACLLRWANQDD